MEPNLVVISAQPNPNPTVRRAGFSLDDPYVERCWAPVLGPSSILLLRRIPDLWKQSPTVGVRVDELGRSIGLGGGKGRHSPIRHTLDRIVRHRFARWVDDHELAVWTEARPLNDRHLARVPDGVRQDHERLLARHLDTLAGRSESPPAPSPGTNGTQIAQRVDRLQRLSRDEGSGLCR